ncbi:hypothetical protein cyc_02344 [Cyclospora cayetanensis]|uniref:Uncharacterized protein n=1 Tax=Cyclospora cayetanensis TaxID=88456 RepID=A0A1D3DAQ7_9EIME|nr:hypothetical protein cyc_02344 [Cyclospora cayetanensis]
MPGRNVAAEALLLLSDPFGAPFVDRSTPPSVLEPPPLCTVSLLPPRTSRQQQREKSKVDEWAKNLVRRSLKAQANQNAGEQSFWREECQHKQKLAVIRNPTRPGSFLKCTTSQLAFPITPCAVCSRV